MSASEFEVLLVEDNQGDVRLTQEALRETNVDCNVTVANDVAAALRYLRQEGEWAEAARPDLILLDLNLPGVDGRGLLRQIKSEPGLRAIPVVVLTSSDTDDDVRAVYEAGANCCVTKPLRLDQFVRVVRVLTELWLEVARLPA